MKSKTSALRNVRAFIMLSVAAAGAFAPLAANAGVLSPVLLINDDAQNSNVTIQPLRGNVSVLMGSGGNIAVYTGPGGKLMVDAGIAVSKSKVESALDSTGTVPLKYVIDTHYHWDHTDGNLWVADSGGARREDH